MIILSLMPPDMVRCGAVLLGGAICFCNITHAVRPRTLMEILQMRLLSLDGKLQEALDSGILDQADGMFTTRIERDVGRCVVLLI